MQKLIMISTAGEILLWSPQSKFSNIRVSMLGNHIHNYSFTCEKYQCVGVYPSFNFRAALPIVSSFSISQLN